MEVVETIRDARRARAALGGRVALVPTMGALHAGHVALVREARKHADKVAVSLFVNPAQFGPSDDLAKYPRPIDDDLFKCERNDVDLVFHPAVEEMYPPGAAEAVVDVPALTAPLEGRHRPGHFRGVCRVVLKLFHVLSPTAACFGMKDFQQLRVIEALIAALDEPVEIVRCPTVREDDGLALSSRNVHLSADERRRALSIARGLFAARDEHAAGVTQTNRLIATARNALLDPGDLGRVPVSVDYVAAVDAGTLKDVQTTADGPTLLAVAARVGKTRLIDNVLLGSDE